MIKKSLEEKIRSHTAVIGMIGMGYVGLSLLDVFAARGFSLVGYDSNPKKVEKLQAGESTMNFLPLKDLFACMNQGKFTPSADPDILKFADVLLMCVPTSLDQNKIPDFSCLRKAFHTARQYLKKETLVILQSTTYPGTTEEELLPLLEEGGFKVGSDFFLAYVPEISDIGNPNYSFTEVPRIVSGITKECVDVVSSLYQTIGCKVIPVPSTKVAEAAKIVQNTYRLVNISLVNEMKILFDRMGIDVWEVIEAAATKPFGFSPFYPGPGVGGDCIPIVPYYLVWKGKETDGPSSLIELAGAVNDTIPYYVIDKVIEALSRHEKSIKKAKILVLGVGYKKDVNDLRYSISLKILSLLQQRMADVHYHDPYVQELSHLEKYPHLQMKSEKLDYTRLKDYDLVVIATDHSSYDWKKIVSHSLLIVDTHNVTAGIAGTKEKVVKA